MKEKEKNNHPGKGQRAVNEFHFQPKENSSPVFPKK